MVKNAQAVGEGDKEMIYLREQITYLIMNATWLNIYFNTLVGLKFIDIKNQTKKAHNRSRSLVGTIRREQLSHSVL